MIKVSPAIRLSVGLVILIISLLILAQALGLTPGTEREKLELRKHVSETMANEATLAIVRGDDFLLKFLLDSAVARNSDILSAAVRRNDGVIVAQTSDHPKHWQATDTDTSTPTHVRIPIIIGGAKRASFEISYKPLSSEKHPILHLPMFIVLLIFVGLSGFLGIWIYIKRVLHYLDPSAVVPARVRNALNILTEGVLILDRREQVVLANGSLIDKLNTEEKHLLGKKASKLGWELSPNQEFTEFPWITALASGTKQVGARLLLKHPQEKDKIFRVNSVPILDPNGTSQGTIVVFDDISELEEKTNLLEETIVKLAKSQAAIEVKNKELSFLATRDPLTNCFNRRALYQHLDGKFEGARASDAEYCCIMGDIDHFKRVNDTYGHGVGDEVIKMAANSIKEVVRDIDIVARFGGEEFCVILPGAALEQAYQIAERCRERIAEQTCSGVKVTGSFGVTSIRLGAQTSNELIQQADEALYYSKQHGRNQVTRWVKGMQSTETTH